MPKTVGLAQRHKKYLEIVSFPKNEVPCAAGLYCRAKEFYQVFRLAFGDGFRTVLERRIPNTDLLGAALVNYHLAIELLLKSLICLKEGFLEKTLETHDLTVLLTRAQSHFPSLSKVQDNPNHMLLLQELSSSFDAIRYAEGTTMLSHNKKKGWGSKTPLQELSELLEEIFSILLQCFDSHRKIAPPALDTDQKEIEKSAGETRSPLN